MKLEKCKCGAMQWFVSYRSGIMFYEGDTILVCNKCKEHYPDRTEELEKEIEELEYELWEVCQGEDL